MKMIIIGFFVSLVANSDSQYYNPYYAYDSNSGIYPSSALSPLNPLPVYPFPYSNSLPPNYPQSFQYNNTGNVPEIVPESFDESVAAESIPIKTTGGKKTKGNSVYLILDPKTMSLSMKVTPPPNETDISVPSDKPAPVSAKLKNLPPESTPCSISALTQKLLNSILKFVDSLLCDLVNDVLNLLSNHIDNCLGGDPLLNGLLNDLLSLLNEKLLDMSSSLGKLVNTELDELLKKNSDPDLLNSVNKLLDKKLSHVLDSGQLANLTSEVDQLLNNKLQTVHIDVDTLAQELLKSFPPDLVPVLAQKITGLVNETLKTALKDVNTTPQDLLAGLLADKLLIKKLTADISKLLDDTLKDTLLCDIPTLLKDLPSLTKLLKHIEKLIDDLLKEFIGNLEKLPADLLRNRLGKKDLPDNLLQDIIILLDGELGLLIKQRLKIARDVIGDPKQYKLNMLGSLKNDLDQLLDRALSVPPEPILGVIPKPKLHKTPDDLSSALSNDIIKLVDENLTNKLLKVDKLFTDVEKLLERDQLKVLLDPSIKKLLENLLTRMLETLLNLLIGDPKFTKASNFSTDLGTLVVGILNEILQCDLTCDPRKVPPSPPVDPCPPVCPCPSFYPFPRPPLYPNPSVYPYPPVRPYPPPFGPYSPISPYSRFGPYSPISPYSPAYPTNPLVQNPCNQKPDPSAFVNQLQQYQSSINRNLYQPLSFGNISPLSSLMGDSCYTQGLDSLPQRLINGLDSTLKLTDSDASGGLMSLVNNIANQSNSTSSLPIGLPL